MQIKVRDVDYDSPKITIRTSERGGHFSIHLVDSNGYNWPHLSVSQAKRLIKELRRFVNRQVSREAVIKNGVY
tara:strand:- start:272 stop:490 length:219 start_codon:yes stop_codon:yes gene_type:complete